MAAVILGFLIVALPAGATTIVISPDDCARLVRHVPADGVAYRPGVDAHGRAVMPADLDGDARVSPPDEITIEITVPLGEQIPALAGSAYGASEIGLGRIEVREGRAFYNGQPLATEAEAELRRKCPLAR